VLDDIENPQLLNQKYDLQYAYGDIVTYDKVVTILGGGIVASTGTFITITINLKEAL
jgi:hypothetical protein